MGARQCEAVSGRGPLSSPTPPPAQPGKGQGCPLQAPPRAAAHSCRWGLQPLGSERGGHPADEEEDKPIDENEDPNLLVSHPHVVS